MSCRLAGVVVTAACGRIDFDPLGVDLVLSPPTAQINLSTTLAMTVTNGVPPYSFSTDEGYIDSAGRFFSPAHAGMATVTVQDALSDTASATVTYRGNTLVVLGGLSTGSSVDLVLSSPDAINFTEIGHLPAPRHSGTALVFEDQLIYIGGYIGGANGTAANDEVYASTDGIAWRLLSRLPIAQGSAAAVVHQRELWVLGGYDSGANISQIFRSPDGVRWFPAGVLPTGRHEMDAFSYNDQLFVVGGHETARLVTNVAVRSAAGTWSTQGDFVGADFAASAEANGRYFHGAGTGSVAIQSSSELATWTPCPVLPGPSLEGPGMTEFSGQLVIVGEFAVITSTDCTTWNRRAVSVAASRNAAVQFTPH